MLTLDGAGKVAEARMAFSGVGGTPVRAAAAEAAVAGGAPSTELWRSAGEAAKGELDPPDDLHGSAAYRRHLASVLAARSLEQAYDRAKGASA
jgi:carbon-monoxide dehydrogenase medium subunit